MCYLLHEYALTLWHYFCSQIF